MIITYPLNGIEYDAQDAETYLCSRESGVFSSEDHFKATISNARQINISPGLAWIKNAQFAGKSIAMTESQTLEIPSADGMLNRIDLIVLRFDSAENASSLAVKTGAVASQPEPPTVTRAGGVYELGLYLVSVPAGSTQVNIADITNVMLDEAYCGLMRDGVTAIPTEQLQAQATAIFEQLASQKGRLVSATASVDNASGIPEVNVTFNSDGESSSIDFAFKNLKGVTPVRGVDYWTPTDVETLIHQIIEALPLYDGSVIYSEL